MPITPVTPLVERFDATVEAALERVRSPLADRIFWSASSAADHGLLWHTIGVVRALRRGSVLDALRFSAAMGIESFVTNVAVKSAFRRRRPVGSEQPLPADLHRPVTSSFPSGHATAAFCAATLLVRDGRSRVGWYGLAAVVGASRVYVRLHHPSDVVAGAVLGRVLGAALAPLVPARPTVRRSWWAIARGSRGRRR
ncbi:MAG TPA: phosphatase PAP2 family protein [Acidimicrobiia bacterium]|nr:phosphatase PAP2 family protein [Acidimicrobiia bacterium]